MVHLDVLVIGCGTAGEYAAGYSMDEGRSTDIVESEASIMIHGLAVAMTDGATASQVGDLLNSYPTFSESVRCACQTAA